MRKVDAIKMVKLLNQQCATYHDKECKNCPLVIEKSFNYTCLIDVLYDHRCNEEYFDKLLVEAQKEEEEKLKNTKELNLPVSNVEQLKAVMQENLEKNEPPLNLAHDAVVPSSVTIKKDNVNSPSHYCKGGMECIDVIRAAVSNLPPFEAVCVANIIKYAWRYKDKNGLEDVKKAAKYLYFLQEEMKNND